jgi:hypothetical protein
MFQFIQDKLVRCRGGLRVRDRATLRFERTLPKTLPKLRFLRGFQLRERLLNFELVHWSRYRVASV